MFNIGSCTMKLNICTKLEMFTINYAPMNASGKDTKERKNSQRYFQLRINSTGSNNEWHTKLESVAHQPQMSRTPTTTDQLLTNHKSRGKPNTNHRQTNHKSLAHNIHKSQTTQTQIFGETTKIQRHTNHESAAHRAQISDTTTNQRDTIHESAKHQPQTSGTPITIQSHSNHKSAAYQPQISSTPMTNKQHTSHKSVAHQPLNRSTQTTDEHTHSTSQ
jgi:hypothetical protein